MRPMTPVPTGIGTPSHDVGRPGYRDGFDQESAESGLLRERAEPEGLLRADDDRRQALAKLDGVVVDTLPAVDLVGERDEVRGRVVEGDVEVTRVRAEDRLQAIAHQLHDRLEVELLGQPEADLIDQRQLRRALVRLGQQALRLVEEPRVLQGHAEARGDGGEEPHVRVVEGVPAHVLEVHRPDDPVAGRDRHAQPRLRQRAGRDGARGVGVRAHPEQERSPLADDDRVQALAEGEGRERRANTLVEGVGEADRARGLVVEDDGDRLDPEDLADLLSDEVDDGLEVELPGQGRADLVDHGQLRVPHTGLLHGLRPAQRDRHLLPGERQQVAVRGGVRPVRIVAAHDQGTQRVPIRGDGHAQPLTAAVDGSGGRAGAQHIGGHAARPACAQRHRDVRRRCHRRVRVTVIREGHRPLRLVEQGDPKARGIHQLADDGVDGPVERGHVTARAGRIGDAMERLRHPRDGGDHGPVDVRHADATP